MSYLSDHYNNYVYYWIVTNGNSCSYRQLLEYDEAQQFTPINGLQVSLKCFLYLASNNSYI